MAFAYIVNTIDPNWCIGNSLSTINLDFVNLDTALSGLSAYTRSSVSYLSAAITSLSSTVQAVSANLQTQINYVSANVIKNYNTPQNLNQNSDGTINWDFNLGRNANVSISKNGSLNNPTNTLQGDSGNLVITTLTSGVQITGFGTNWTVGDASSAFTVSFASMHLISYYTGPSSKLIFNVINY
jgi:hypothetical protein